MNNYFTGKHFLTLLCLIFGSAFGQDEFTINYNGISKMDKSPHVEDKDGNIGIKNPERGYSVRGGVIDFYSSSDFPDSNYFENFTTNSSSILDPLSFYLDNYVDDGISLVETEVYVKYKDSLDNNSSSISSSDLSQPAVDILPVFHHSGVKTHLILNSSFEYHENESGSVKSICEDNDLRTTKNLEYLDALSPFFEDINPYTAVVHLGWISTPWDYNDYRLSSHWTRTNWGAHSVYAAGTVDKSTNFLNYHNSLRESTQRSAWGQIGNKASIYHYQSGINLLKKKIIDKTLQSFPEQKILLKSTMAVGNYIGTAMGFTDVRGPVWTPEDSENHVDKVLSGHYNNFALDSNISHLKNNEGYLRFGYYDHAFGGETYDHYWTIGNSSSQEIPWNETISSTAGALWGSNPFFTDVYNLRKYRTNLWVHGEMPIYETEDPSENLSRNSAAWTTSSFNQNHSYREQWYNLPYGAPPAVQNKQFDYEIGEGISSGRLQDGFYSALKLRYFNYSSFNITHNNELDGRSPYEMPDGFTSHADGLSSALVGNGIPLTENTAIQGWKTKLIEKSDLEEFGMPVSDRYFSDENGNDIPRTAYEYIRDHLGYRLELQSTKFKKTSTSVLFNTKIINRGFAMPQNGRSIYFCLLNENNELINSYEADYDWRGWEPDGFAVANENVDNLETEPIGESNFPLNQTKVGGIPLGTQNSNWFQSSIHPNYQGYEHVLYGSFNMEGMPAGRYKIGIILPDNSTELYDNPDFSVKFANQARYLDCKGITILGSIINGNSGVEDSDDDGIPNATDDNPYNPIELAQTGVTPESTPCVEIQTLETSHFEDNELSNSVLFYNESTLELTFSDEISAIQIFDVNGKLVLNQNTLSGALSLQSLEHGVFFVHAFGNDKKTTLKVVR